MKAVSSRDNPAYKAMARLAASAPERRRRALTVLDGAHLVAAFLDAGLAVDSLMVSRSALEEAEVASLVRRAAPAPVTVLGDALFATLSTVNSATGLLAAVRVPEGRPVPPGADLVLLLEEIQDPGNLGTLLRSAAAAGVKHVLLSKNSVFAWSLKVVRAAMGAHFAVNIVEGADLAAFLAAYRGTSVALAGRARSSLYEVDLRGPVAILVGNEGSGLSKGLLERATTQARIPMPGAAESLNAAVACSVCLFEALRQRQSSTDKHR
jgi:TrmH family RNA methyltransferase